MCSFVSVKVKAYFVGADKAQAEGGQHFDDCRAAVALDWEVRLHLWHCALPAYMLPHQGTEVTHYKRNLLHLETQEKITIIVHEEYTKQLVEPLVVSIICIYYLKGLLL